MKAAETGHLVFSTLHTNDAIQSINRIINMYDSQFRDNIRKQLSDILRGTISQKLLRTKEGGYHPACEILVVTPTIKDFILKDELDKIYELMTEGEYNGMITMNKSLYELVQKKFITEDEALEVSNSPSELQLMLKGAYHGMN